MPSTSNIVLATDGSAFSDAAARFLADGKLLQTGFTVHVVHVSPDVTGQVRAFGQRMSASPSLAGRSVVPHSGHSVGMTNGRSDPSRRSATGPSTSGIRQNKAMRARIMFQAIAVVIIVLILIGSRGG